MGSREISSPASISPDARVALERVIGTDGVPVNALFVMPAPDDVERWEENKAIIDGNHARMLTDASDVPAATVDTSLFDGAVAHIATPTMPVATDTVYLELHGGALIFGGGRSAGSNLAAAMLLRAKDEGLSMPAGPVLLSPEVELTESGASFAVNAGVDGMLPGSLMASNRLYAGGADLADPYLSPLVGDVPGFPPTFLLTGTRDLFLSNTVRMHRRLLAAVVRAELHVFEAMPHGGFGGTPEDREAAREMTRFVHERLSLG